MELNANIRARGDFKTEIGFLGQFTSGSNLDKFNLPKRPLLAESRPGTVRWQQDVGVVITDGGAPIANAVDDSNIGIKYFFSRGPIFSFDRDPATQYDRYDVFHTEIHAMQLPTMAQTQDYIQNNVYGIIGDRQYTNASLVSKKGKPMTQAMDLVAGLVDSESAAFVINHVTAIDLVNKGYHKFIDFHDLGAGRYGKAEYTTLAAQSTWYLKAYHGVNPVGIKLESTGKFNITTVSDFTINYGANLVGEFKSTGSKILYQADINVYMLAGTLGIVIQKTAGQAFAISATKTVFEHDTAVEGRVNGNLIFLANKTPGDVILYQYGDLNNFFLINNDYIRLVHDTTIEFLRGAAQVALFNITESRIEYHADNNIKIFCNTLGSFMQQSASNQVWVNAAGVLLQHSIKIEGKIGVDTVFLANTTDVHIYQKGDTGNFILINNDRIRLQHDTEIDMYIGAQKVVGIDVNNSYLYDPTDTSNYIKAGTASCSIVHDTIINLQLASSVFYATAGSLILYHSTVMQLKAGAGIAIQLAPTYSSIFQPDDNNNYIKIDNSEILLKHDTKVKIESGTNLIEVVPFIIYLKCSSGAILLELDSTSLVDSCGMQKGTGAGYYVWRVPVKNLGSGDPVDDANLYDGSMFIDTGDSKRICVNIGDDWYEAILNLI